MDLVAGAMLTENLQLVRELGAGGMGTVWVAKNTALGSEVAVKVLRPVAGEAGDEGRRRFEQEARTIAQLDHPHLVKVFDYGMTPEGDPFIVMELLKGEDLARRLKRAGRVDAATTLGIVNQTCKALARAHAGGVVHRDIKPANVFLLEGDDDLFVKVLDFGVAKLASGDLQLTKTGTVIGTPYFMSPEQFMAPRDIDPRSDLWSIAVLAYTCLTGRLPFQGDTLAAVGMAVSMGRFSLPSTVRAELPRALDAFMQKALATGPAERFQSAKELSAALATALSEARASAAPRAAASDVDPEEGARHSSASTVKTEVPAAKATQTGNAIAAALGVRPVEAEVVADRPRRSWVVPALLLVCGVLGGALAVQALQKSEVSRSGVAPPATTPPAGPTAARSSTNPEVTFATATTSPDLGAHPARAVGSPSGASGDPAPGPGGPPRPGVPTASTGPSGASTGGATPGNPSSKRPALVRSLAQSCWAGNEGAKEYGNPASATTVTVSVDGTGRGRGRCDGAARSSGYSAFIRCCTTRVSETNFGAGDPEEVSVAVSLPAAGR